MKDEKKYTVFKLCLACFVTACVITSAVLITNIWLGNEPYVDVDENTIRTEWVNDCQLFDFSGAVNENGGVTNTSTKNLTLVFYNTVQGFIHPRLFLVKPQEWASGRCNNGGVDFWKYYGRPSMTFSASCLCTSESRTLFNPRRIYVDSYLPLCGMWYDPSIYSHVNLSMTLHQCEDGSYIPNEIRTCHLWAMWNNKIMPVPFEVKT